MHTARAPRRSYTRCCLFGVESLVLLYNLKQAFYSVAALGIATFKYLFSNPPFYLENEQSSASNAQIFEVFAEALTDFCVLQCQLDGGL